MTHNRDLRAEWFAQIDNAKRCADLAASELDRARLHLDIADRLRQGPPTKASPAALLPPAGDPPATDRLDPFTTAVRVSHLQHAADGKPIIAG